jgi:hypothetical protein
MRRLAFAYETSFHFAISYKNIPEPVRAGRRPVYEDHMSEAIKPTLQAYDRYVLVCVSDRCAGDGGGQALYDELRAKLSQISADNAEIKLKRGRVTCFGVCKARAFAQRSTRRGLVPWH